MDFFNYRNNRLYAEDVDLMELVATYGTPCYVYSRATLERHWHAFDNVFKGREHLVCYAVKANSNIAVLNILAKLGSGFDIVSSGELERVLHAGGDSKKIVFSGVGKSKAEISRAIDVGIYCFNVESASELDRINDIAGQMGERTRISLRVNPDVDARTHPYIATGLKENKFGIDIASARSIYLHAAGLPHIDIAGLDCHIGSQLTEVEPFIDAVERLLELADALKDDGIVLRHIDIGGGLGITYRDEEPPSPESYAQRLLEKFANRDYAIFIEPGRAIAGNAGILLTRVEYIKHGPHKNFAIVDAGMNDLVRPALYDAWQAIIPVVPRNGEQPRRYDIVGPVCETGDFLGKDRELAIQSGDVLAVRSAGAYGFVMSSNYNSRPRAPEVVVDGERMHLARPREQLSALFTDEQMLP